MNTKKSTALILAILMTVACSSGCKKTNEDNLTDTDVTIQTSEYAKQFDKNTVMTFEINATEENWQHLLDNAIDKEYISADVIINGTEINNVGIRAKGNSSLTSVSSSESDRYSFKIKFDEYVDGQTYMGLDKMVINNIWSDNTYMKEYLSFDIMNYIGVDTPLYSFADISVNGESFGLYLAIEDTETSYLERTQNGEGVLYKPDTMDMAGGMGDMKMPDGDFGGFGNFDFNADNALENDDNNTNNESPVLQEKAAESAPKQNPPAETSAAVTAPAEVKVPEKKAAETSSEQTQPEIPENAPDGEFGGFGDGNPPEKPDGDFGGFGDGNHPERPDGDFGDGMTPPAMPQSNSNDNNFTIANMSLDTDNTENTDMPNPNNSNDKFTPPNMDGNFGGGMNGASDGVSLDYTDDNESSYSAIFDNEKTKTDEADHARVIAALKALNEGTDLSSCIDVDACLKYFAAHNIVVNLDSYTSNMGHNYVLYENNGILTILPWDYNLAFGGFMSGGASEVVNMPIDTPVSNVEMSERPLLAKLLENEEYLAKYHEYLSEIVSGYFADGKFEQTVNSLNTLISDYVKNDATKFCTFDEYETAVAELIKLGTLRGESVQGQLNGTIPSTSEGQKSDSSALIDTSSINLSALGSQGGEHGGDKGNFGGFGGMDMDIMRQAMEIFGDSTELTDEQREKLVGIGIAEDEIDTLFEQFNSFKKGNNFPQ